MSGRRKPLGLGTGSGQCGKGEVQTGLSVPLGHWPWASQDDLLPKVPNTVRAAAMAAGDPAMGQPELWMCCHPKSGGCEAIVRNGHSLWFVMQGEEMSIQA